MFNYLERSHTTSQDKWIFYVDYEKESGIYAQKKNSNYNKLLISEVDPGSPISVVGNGLYYVSNNKVMRYDLKTEETIVVINEPVFYFIVVKDIIYYIPNEEDRQLYSIKTNGTDNQILVSNLHYSSYFVYDKGKIFYVDIKSRFVSLSLENFESKIISENVSPIFHIMNNKFIFSLTEGIRLLDIESNNWTTIIPRENLRKIVRFDEDTIIYSTFVDENQSLLLDTTQKYKISTNTLTDTDLDILNIYHVNVIDGIHYYYSGSPRNIKREIY